MLDAVAWRRPKFRGSRLNRRGWLLLVLPALAVFAGLLVYGDLRNVRELLADAPAPYGAFGAALGLAFVNYILRYVRWAIYLQSLNIRAPLWVNVQVFAAGLALSITPGKVGELLKCAWLSRRAGVPVSASAPAVVMERLTDVISVAALGLVGVALLPLAVSLTVLAVLAAMGVIAALAASRYGVLVLRLPLLRRWQQPLEHSQEGFRHLMSPRLLIAGIGLGALAWAAEGIALWVLVIGLGDSLSPVVAVPISAAAALVGAITALPGGLIGFEGSMVALLVQTGLDNSHAAFATLLTRLATLWFAVLIGLFAFLWLTKSGTASETAGDAATARRAG